MGYFILQYEVVDDFVERRAEIREEHLGLLREAQQRGELILAGAVGDPVDGSLLVFRADDSSPAESLALNDPYVINGLVTNWTVKPWNVVIE